MNPSHADGSWKIVRRHFLGAAGVATAGLVFQARAASAPAMPAGGKGMATIRGAFLYPSTQSLREAGYYSWPGSNFDAEGHHKDYLAQIDAMAKKLNVRIVMDDKPLHEPDSVSQFINEAKQQKPDGLLLIPFKKSEWASVVRIVEEAGTPTIAMATLGVLLMPHINQLRQSPGVYVISSLDNFDAIEDGLRMIRTIRWMKDALLLNVTGTQAKEMIVDKWETRIRVVPMQRLVDVYKSTEMTDEVRKLANTYLTQSKECREPGENDVFDAARACFACKRLIAAEGADAIMIQCLQGIKDGDIPPPCMGFMTMRDEGIVAGCQSDLDATLTMMIVQQLCNKPGFQQNAACDTEKNLYFGAHCTCPSKLDGPDGQAAPYILRNHAEAGVGTVPQVLWPEGKEITLAHYERSRKGTEPRMIVNTGKVVTCHDTPPAGGCRTNVVVKIDDVPACEVKGMHQTIFAGNHARQLRAFCQMIDLPVVS